MLTTEESTQWDVQNFELCVQKILEHSGFKIIRESSATLKGINFLAKGQNGANELHGVSCISQEETLGREDLEAIVAEGNSLSCQSNFVISLTPVSPDATAWAKENDKISLVDQRTFLHSYQQLPDEVKNRIENLATKASAKEISEQKSAPPVPEVRGAQVSDSPRIDVGEEAEFSSNHHKEPTASKKREDLSKTSWKMWLMVSGGALICLFVLVYLAASVARALLSPEKAPGKQIVEQVFQKKPESIPGDGPRTIPAGVAAGSDTPGEVAPMVSKGTASVDRSSIAEAPVTELAHNASGNPEPSVPGGNSPAMIHESPFAATETVAPSIPTSAFAAEQFPDDKSFAYVDLNIPQDAPTRESTEGDDLERILTSIWDLDKLEGDPFFDLGQAILTRNLAARSGPLSKDESMALWALSGKLKDYPHLGCGALTILSAKTIPHFLNSLDSAIRNLQDPFLSFQVASTKAGLMGASQSSGEALDSLKRILQIVEPEQLPDSIAFFLIAGEFASGLRSAAPDEFINLVEKSSAIPGWLKDYVGGKSLYSRAGEDGLDRVAEMITKFESSWKSNPGHPAAAAELIMLNSIVSGGELSEIRPWFDRAIKAQADYKAAYYNYAKALAEIGDPSARWGIEFGKSCCRTGRFDTTVPLTLIDAHTLRCAELGKTPDQYWSSLAESDIEDLEVLFQKLGETNHLPYEAAVEKSLESVIWYFAGDEEKSARCLKEENFVFDARAFDSLRLPAKNRKVFNEFMDNNGS